MKIKIDKEQCIGCETCCTMCGEFFEMDSNNKSSVKQEKQGELKDAGCSEEAAKACPVQCIRVE